jgi:hypothetical protein
VLWFQVHPNKSLFPAGFVAAVWPSIEEFETEGEKSALVFRDLSELLAIECRQGESSFTAVQCLSTFFLFFIFSLSFVLTHA